MTELPLDAAALVFMPEADNKSYTQLRSSYMPLPR